MAGEEKRNVVVDAMGDNIDEYTLAATSGDFIIVGGGVVTTAVAPLPAAAAAVGARTAPLLLRVHHVRTGSGFLVER